MYSDGARADGAVDALDAYITRILHDDYAPALPPVLDRSDMPAYILAGRLAGLRPGADEPALATLTRLHARLATAAPPAHPRARRPAWLLVAAVVPWVLVLALGATLALSQHSQPAPGGGGGGWAARLARPARTARLCPRWYDRLPNVDAPAPPGGRPHLRLLVSARWPGHTRLRLPPDRA